MFGKGVMAMFNKPGPLDQEALSIVIAVLHQALASLPPDQRTEARQMEMASRILAKALAGERDSIRLRTAALVRTTSEASAA